MSEIQKLRRMMEALVRRYDTLQIREQRALMGLMWFAAAVFLWLAVWEPVQRMRSGGESRFRLIKADLDWMRAHELQARALVHSSSAALVVKEGTTLLSLVSDAAMVHRLSLSRAEPSADGTLRVTIERASFGRLLAWLDELKRVHGLQPMQIVIEPQDAPGYVSTIMVLKP